MPQKKKTCFVIGPIGKSGSDTRRRADFLLNGIIRPALENEKELRLWRADEDSRPGMITDKVINDINDSDLVIADLSELNPNAFYELGIRHSAGKPTIHMAAQDTALPFDNLGHRTIFFEMSDWENIENSRKLLLEQFRQALAPDYEASNPVTQALNAKAFKASPSSTEKAMGQIMRRLENLETNSMARPASFTEKHILEKFERIMRDTYIEIVSDDPNSLSSDFGDIFIYTIKSMNINDIERMTRKPDPNKIRSIILENDIPF